jgi:predicted transcriptional regulator
MKKKTRTYAPSLVSGRLRYKNAWLRLAPSIKAGLKEIARNENQTMNWVIEQVLIDYFHLEEPKYKVRKNGK